VYFQFALMAIDEIFDIINRHAIDRDAFVTAARGTEDYLFRAAILKEMECCAENLNGVEHNIRRRYPLIYPEVLEHLVDQRNHLAHEYQQASYRLGMDVDNN